MRTGGSLSQKPQVSPSLTKPGWTWEVAGMTFVAKPTTGCCKTYQLNLVSWGEMYLNAGAESS